MRASVYRKNIRQWEQWSRIVVGLALIGVAVVVPSALVAVLVAASGVVVAATGVVGWCPACAMVGRRLEAETARASH